MNLDLQYIDNWSLKLDLVILFRTIGVVLSGKDVKRFRILELRNAGIGGLRLPNCEFGNSGIEELGMKGPEVGSRRSVARITVLPKDS
jgi:hypothetical protein